MKEFFTLIKLVSPRNILHFLLLLKKEPKRYIFANINQKVQSLRTPYTINGNAGVRKDFKLIVNGFVRDNFYKVRGHISHDIDQLSIVDGSGSLNETIQLTKEANGVSFDALVKIKSKKEKLYLIAKDGTQTKKIKLSKFLLSTKRNCNKTEVYRMKVDEEKSQASTSKPQSSEDILFSFILENNTGQASEINQSIAGLLAQNYKNWELLIPISDKNRQLAATFKHDQIKCIELESNYSTATRNDIITKCAGNYIGILKDKNVLHKDCLLQCHHAIKNNASPYLLYVDSDVIDENQERKNPTYRPPLSIDQLRCMNYVGDFYLFSKEAFTKTNGYTAESNLYSSHYDFILRLADHDQHKIVHVDNILLHVNKQNKNINTSSSTDDISAIQQHLERNKLHAQVTASDHPGIYEIEYLTEEQALISIIIPFKNEFEVLKTCVESIFEKTSYGNYEIILVDHESTDQAVCDYYKALEKEHDHIKTLHYKGDFNYSAINNWAIQFTNGSYFVFLNNDTEVLSEGWLNRMYQYARQDQIGVVGVLLLYPDNTIQHDGVYFGYLDKELKYPTSQYINKMQTIGEENAYYPYVVKNVKAVTAACMMVSKEDFLSVNGFDEVRFKVTCNDTDLCFRIGKNKRIVSLPDVILTHYESKSRGLNDTFRKIRLAQRELQLFYDLHKDQFEDKEIIFNV